MRRGPAWSRSGRAYTWSNTRISASTQSLKRLLPITPTRSISSSSSNRKVMSDFPISWVRECFPALNLGDNFIFFDNGAGAQIPQVALDAVEKHLILSNLHRGGGYRHSVLVDEAIKRSGQWLPHLLTTHW